jgi:hypothetical protein
MLELTQHTCKLVNVNPRAEKHGKELAPACDLKFEALCPSSVLVHFHPELRQYLFKKDENPDLADQGAEDELTALRFPKMGGLAWSYEGTGYTLTVDYGLGGDSNIELEDCKVDKIAFEPMVGGTVRLTFRVIGHPEAAAMGRLCELIQREVAVDLTGPEPANASDLFKDAA